MKKIAISISIIVLLLIAAIGALVYSYTKTPEYKEVVLPESTSINGIDCSKLTYDEAEKKLSKEWNKKHLVVTGNLNNILTSFTDFGYEYDLIPQLKKIKTSNVFAAAMNHYINAPFNVSMTMKTSAYDEAFMDEVATASCFKAKDAAPAQDAYVDLSDPEFPIVPEILGTDVDPEKLFDAITHSIEMGNMNFIFDEKEYFSSPEVTADDPELLAYQKFCKKYLKQKITYELGEETFTIPAEQLATMMKDDMSGTVNEDAVKTYVASLAATYDNVGKSRKFTSFDGSEIKVSGGIYGWIIDQEAETAKLISDINSHNDVSREPVFAQKGFGTYALQMGDTYIDMNVSNQRVKYYKQGELVFESHCVTGDLHNGTTTDIGVQCILNRVPNAVLRGDNVDGSEYECPVSYWLGINWDGEGFHDATWRGNWSGNAWRYDGSHGCINMPLNKMSVLYKIAEIGTPVIVHY